MSSWEDSPRGLLPGTIVAVLLVLGALAAYWTGHMVIAVIVGIIAAFNAFIAITHWLRLLSS